MKDNNGTCQPTQVGECVPCVYSPGYPVYYYQVNESPDSDWPALAFYDSLCTEEYSYVSIISNQCSSEFGNCMFFTQLASTITLTLTLTSTEPVVVTFTEQYIYTQISSNKVSAQGEHLSGVNVHSGGKTFFVERQVSSTQYSTNLGVFTLGESYTESPFTFTVTANEVDFPLPVYSDVTTITFANFFSAQVTDDKTYPLVPKNLAQIIVVVEESYGLEGLVLTNPNYSIQNMTFYPPFQQNNYGELVFQLEASSSPFLTLECHQDATTMDNDYTYNTYKCQMGSSLQSRIIYDGKVLSEVAEQKIRQPDEMSFSLF